LSSNLAFGRRPAEAATKPGTNVPAPSARRIAVSSCYHEVYAACREDPESFWSVAAREIDWYKPWDKVFDPYAGQYGRWFVGAE
jgi:hypothetical protein